MKPDRKRGKSTAHRLRTAFWCGATAVLCGLMITSGHAQIEVEVEGTTESVQQTRPAGAADAQTTTGPETTGAVDGAKAAAAADSPEAVAAIEAAYKLVAPRSEVVTAEEETSFSLPTVLTGEPMMLEGRMLMAQTGGSTEARAIASGAELLRMLGVAPRKAPVGDREVDDPGAVNLFPNEEEVRKLLGDNPQVVYRVVVNGTPLPDPMIIPWIRQGRVVEELFDEAVDLLGKGRIDSAREKLLSIVTEYPATEQAAQAKEILQKLSGLRGTPTPRTFTVKATPSPTPVEIQMNPNVKVSTVMIDPTNPAASRVVIGGKGYGIGEKVRSFPDHKVISISDDTVVIEVDKQGVTKQFPIPVRPAGSN